MFLYSKTILRFVEEIKQIIREILHTELHLKCAGDRFYDRAGRYSYPIKVVLYDHRPFLGYFDSEFYELGVHECLLRAKKEQLHNIIRHELAHYMVFITHGLRETPHDPLFRAFCKQVGWGEEVYRARTAIDLQEPQEEHSVLRKVKKLMALAASCHQHESEQATIKSQQLLLKYNLEFPRLQEGDSVAMQRILQQKKETAKMRAIASILQTFLVSIVYHRGREFTYVEIVGKPVNVKIAEYVADVLDRELERLWNQTQKKEKLQGKIAKNSFFLGVAKGYCNKIEAFQKDCSADTARGLMVLEKKLTEVKKLVYSRLSSKSSSTRCCSFSAKLGEKAGKGLNIAPAISKASSVSQGSIVYNKSS